MRADALFATALQYHRAGRLAEAESFYQQALASNPNHADALHNLGLLARRAGRHEAAAALIGKAAALSERNPLFHNNHGAALKDQGRLAEAEAAYRRATSLKPDYAEAHNNLGIVLQDGGDLDAARAAYQRAIALRPDYPAAHNNLGLVLRAKGQLDAAAAAHRRAIALDARHPEAHVNLGIILQQQRHPGEAAACYRRAVALRPGDANTLNNLGVALRDSGQPNQAVEAYRRALALAPNDAKLHYNLGIALRDLRLPRDAVACFRQACTLDPGHAQAHNSLGMALHEQDAPQEAIAAYEAALAVTPNFPEAHNNLAVVLHQQGRLTEAEAAYGRAIALKPDYAEAFNNLARLRPLNDGTPEAETVFALLSRQVEAIDTFEADRRSQLLFAMGEALTGRGDFDRAFDCLKEANALRRAGLSFDITEAEQRLQSIANVFDEGLVRRLHGEGAPSELPIFIVGMPRSGTTLVEQIVSAHPKVQGAGELAILEALAAKVRGPDGSGYPFWGTTLTGEDCRNLATAYLDGLPPDTSGGRLRLTDKWVDNFENLGLIQLCLPNARIIHCRRDPRDVGLSCYAIRFNDGQDYAYDLTELGRYWRAYDRLMAHWRRILPAGRMLEVPYEAVVEDLDSWARRLIAHCGLDWDDSCLRFHESRRTVRTASSAQVRRPVYTGSVGRWRAFADHLAPLLVALGAPWDSID